MQEIRFEIAGKGVGPLALGCSTYPHWVGEAEATAIVHAAIDSGIGLIDTANVYPNEFPGASEEFLGRVLGDRRDDIVLATKFGHPRLGEAGAGAAPGNIRRSIEASLTRLRTDHVDLYQLHKPDPSIPIGDVLVALDGLVDEGKVLAIGCSQFTAAQLDEAAAAAADLSIPSFRTVQNEFSMLRGARQADVLQTCLDLGMEYMPFYPLAGGLLTGTYRRSDPAPRGARLTEQLHRSPHFDPSRFIDPIESLGEFAAAHGHSLLELAMGWLLSQPGVGCLLVGASQVEQVAQNVEASSAWRMTPDEMTAVDHLLSPLPGFGDPPDAGSDGTGSDGGAPGPTGR